MKRYQHPQALGAARVAIANMEAAGMPCRRPSLDDTHILCSFNAAFIFQALGAARMAIARMEAAWLPWLRLPHYYTENQF